MREFRFSGVGLKNLVELRILGQRLVIKSDEDEAEIRRVESYLNEKLEEVKENTTAVSTLDQALLVALNVAAEFMKARAELEGAEQKADELSKLIDRRLV